MYNKRETIIKTVALTIHTQTNHIYHIFIHKQDHTLTHNHNEHTCTRHQRDMNSDFRYTKINLCRKSFFFGRQCISADYMLQHGSKNSTQSTQHTPQTLFQFEIAVCVLEVDKTSLQHTREFSNVRAADVLLLSMNLCHSPRISLPLK